MAAHRKTIREAQQELAENCGYGSDIIWDLLTADDAGIMKTKIKQLIPDQPKGQSEIEDLRATIFKNVWKQRKYTNRTSISYIFYVLVTKNENFNTALDSVEFSCHPVFRCKKCDNNSDTSNCCMIYIDEAGRVYQNWKSFVKENILPAGTMVTPRKGIYNFMNDKVILDVYRTPRGTDDAKAMSALQTGSSIAGLGAAVVPIAAMVFPVAAPIVAAASTVGLCVGAFTAITSALNLSDRNKHAQSISISNNQARASYLGVVGGSIGMAAAGATRMMTSMAAAGRGTAAMEVVVNGINISSIVLSGSGVANGVLDLIFKYNDGDDISTMDILQLSASLVLFTHSIYNFQLASQVANDARVKSIKSYRDKLSTRQRKMFDKMSKETVRIRGSRQGKMDIIRGMNEIPDRQYLNDLFKINKQLNQRNVRPAFAKSGGNIVLNNELPVEAGTLRQSVQHQKGPNVLEQVTQPIPSNYKSDTYTTKTPQMARLIYSNVNFEESVDLNYDPLKRIPHLGQLILLLPNDITIPLKDYGSKFMENIADIHKFYDVILSMADNLSESTFKFLMQLAEDFVCNFLDEIHEILKMYIPTESVLYRILQHVLENYSNLCHDYMLQKRSEIIEAIRKYYRSFSSRNLYANYKICPDCYGTISICGL